MSETPSETPSDRPPETPPGSAPASQPAARRHQDNFREILSQDVNFDFVGKRKFFAVFSAVLVAFCIGLFVFVGPNWGIDFTGGTEVQVHFTSETSVAEVRDSLTSVGVGDDAIQKVDVAIGSRYLIRVQGASGTRPEEVEAVKKALSAFGPDWIEEFRIDAEVGTRATVIYKGDVVPLEKINAALSAMKGVSVQPSPEDNTFYVRLPGLAEDIRSHLETNLKDRGTEIERIDSIGPKVGGSLRTAGLISTLLTMGLLLVYIGFRFDFAYAPGAILCLFHDASIVLGVWVVTQMEFGLPMVSAVLTLVGYSINDTIVTYDRIRENSERYRRKQLPQLINDSVNQTLARTIITSSATALALIPFLFFGGPVLQQFAIAMLVGMVAGTYSTIYVASPIMILIKENEDFLRGLVGLRKKQVKDAATP